jgi:nucleotide-binding universal stress UspA family protein
MFRKIVVPTDFSEPAAAALSLACELALTLDTVVELMHVFQLPRMALPDGSTLVATPAEATDAMRHGEAALAAAKRGCRAPVTTRLVEGSIPEAILDAVGTDDLVVMGTHGRTGLSHLLLGSITEKVVRKATCPVLTVGTASVVARHQPQAAAG